MNVVCFSCKCFKLSSLLFAIILFSSNSFAQTNEQNPVLHNNLSVGREVVDGDTIPIFMLDEIVVVGKCVFKNEKERAKYSKLVRDIKKTLPYARLCKKELDEIDRTLNGLQGKQEKELYLKNAEKELFAQFEKPLKKLTYTQGRLLIKLIDRETGNTSYDLIKDFKGGFSAFVWQSVARMFGSNLKSEYEGSGEDMAIESIIYFIDKGVY